MHKIVHGHIGKRLRFIFILQTNIEDVQLFSVTVQSQLLILSRLRTGFILT